jgi:methionine synthase I (cobalamin-dependent)
MSNNKHTEGNIEMVRSSDNSRWQIKAVGTDKLPGLVLFEHTYDGEQAKANAQRIVTAWNFHNDLVRVITDLVVAKDKKSGTYTIGQHIEEARKIISEINKP